MRKSDILAAAILAVFPLVYMLYFQTVGEMPPESSSRLLYLIPIGLGLLLLVLGMRIHRLIDVLPIVALILLHIVVVFEPVSDYKPSPLPEMAIPALILVTQISLLSRYRKSVESICFVLTGLTIIASLLPSFLPALEDPIFLNRLNTPVLAPVGWSSPWNVSDITAILFILVAATFAVLPKRNPRSLRFEYLIALIPLFLYFESIAVSNVNALTSTVCMSSLIAIILIGLGRLFVLHAYVDELTGLQNRRAFDERIKRLSGSFALSIIDIDHFKHFNDTYGHSEGDNALRWTAAHLADVSGRRAYRYGGEEFCVVFPERLSSEAAGELEILRKGLDSDTFSIRKIARSKNKSQDRKKRGQQPATRQAKITVSIGVAQRIGRREPALDVLKRADKALYQAKAGGRNQICAAQ